MEGIAAGQWAAEMLLRFWRRRGQVMITGGGRLSALGGRGRAIVDPPKNATLEERVAYLERSHRRLEEVIDQLDQRLEAEQKARDAADEEERRGWTEAVDEIRGRVRSLTVGSIRREIVGVVWLVAGLLLTTWSPELAGHRWGTACRTVSVPVTTAAAADHRGPTP
jgi:hypothetical protein